METSTNESDWGPAVDRVNAETRAGFGETDRSFVRPERISYLFLGRRRDERYVDATLNTDPWIVSALAGTNSTCSTRWLCVVLVDISIHFDA